MSVTIMSETNPYFGHIDFARSNSEMDNSSSNASPFMSDRKDFKGGSFRRRSIPLAFDFDLDEVWAPVSPQLKSLQRNHLQQIGRASSASSSTHSLYRGSRKPTEDINLSKSQDSEEFAVDNDDIFQNISSHHHNHHSWTKNENRNLNDSLTTFASGLPSARTLRGGQPPAVRGRHSSVESKSPISTEPRPVAVNTSRNRKGSINSFQRR